jgi:hypothetical protein
VLDNFVGNEAQAVKIGLFKPSEKAILNLNAVILRRDAENRWAEPAGNDLHP